MLHAAGQHVNMVRLAGPRALNLEEEAQVRLRTFYSMPGAVAAHKLILDADAACAAVGTLVQPVPIMQLQRSDVCGACAEWGAAKGHARGGAISPGARPSCAGFLQALLHHFARAMQHRSSEPAIQPGSTSALHAKRVIASSAAARRCERTRRLSSRSGAARRTRPRRLCGACSSILS